MVSGFDRARAGALRACRDRLDTCGFSPRFIPEWAANPARADEPTGPVVFAAGPRTLLATPTDRDAHRSRSGRPLGRLPHSGSGASDREILARSHAVRLVNDTLRRVSRVDGRRGFSRAMGLLAHGATPSVPARETPTSQVCRGIRRRARDVSGVFPVPRAGRSTVSSGSEPLSSTVVRAVADAEDVDPSELGFRLNEEVDADALDALQSHAGTDWTLEVEIHGHEVEVGGDGTVQVDGRTYRRE